MSDLLTIDDYASILAVIAMAGAASTLTGFCRATLRALDRRLGWRGTRLVVAETAPRRPGSTVARLNTGLARRGYLIVSPRLDARERAILEVLREPLAQHLRHHLLAEPAELDLSLLTPREREVAQLIARGYSNDTIGTSLGIRLDTVKKHVSRVLSKLEMSSRAQVAASWHNH
jgi:DNA-binding CsgD family transcriptional regulator